LLDASCCGSGVEERKVGLSDEWFTEGAALVAISDETVLVEIEDC